MQHLVVPTFVLNPKRQVVIWNRACERLTGVTGGRNPRHQRALARLLRNQTLLPGRPGRAGAAGQVGHALFAACGSRGRTRLLRRELVRDAAGSAISCISPSMPVPIHDEDGKLIAVVETLRDMTDQKRAEAALKTLAASDGLTGLANRRSFDQTLAMEWARAERTKKPLSLVLVDVDHFKLYNDLHGHQQRRRVPARGGLDHRRDGATPGRPVGALRRRGIRDHHARDRAESRRSRWPSGCAARWQSFN